MTSLYVFKFLNAGPHCVNVLWHSSDEGVLLHGQVKIKYCEQYLKHWKLHTLVLDVFKTPKAVSTEDVSNMPHKKNFLE